MTCLASHPLIAESSIAITIGNDEAPSLNLFHVDPEIDPANVGHPFDPFVLPVGATEFTTVVTAVVVSPLTGNTIVLEEEFKCRPPGVGRDATYTARTSADGGRLGTRRVGDEHSGCGGWGGEERWRVWSVGGAGKV